MIAYISVFIVGMVWGALCTLAGVRHGQTGKL